MTTEWIWKKYFFGVNSFYFRGPHSFDSQKCSNADAIKHNIHASFPTMGRINSSIVDQQPNFSSKIGLSVIPESDPIRFLRDIASKYIGGMFLIQKVFSLAKNSAEKHSTAEGELIFKLARRRALASLV